MWKNREEKNEGSGEQQDEKEEDWEDKNKDMWRLTTKFPV